MDLAADPNWQVYEFERDGIRYVQVNDRTGIVRAAVGRIGDTFWVLPLGRDADRVSLPGNVVPRGQGKLLYRNNEVEIIQNRNGGQDHWIVRAPVIGQNRRAVRAQRAGQ
ncbi:MAG: hypothetical protein E6Q88_09275 [Lysobacteraceae bacterium]|nr:MAG: hypothetical protein E6Q88_09275 [Xanthomonadaceae bacterium]